MQYVRFKHNGKTGYGLVQDGVVKVLEGDFFGERRLSTAAVAIGDVTVLAPVVPTKIVGVGLNYRTHAAELDMALPEEPLLFLKPPTAIVGPGDAIVLPDMSARVDYEAELAVIIGKPCRNVAPEEARDYICGYSCINDVTARDLQRRDVQFTRSKSFDTFAPLGPCIATGIDPEGLQVESFVNGQRRQSGSTADFVFGVSQLVAFISSVMTLLPGDVIATGTPAGVGPLAPGDEVEVRVTGIGSLVNPVRR